MTDDATDRAGDGASGESYPLKNTAAVLNDRLGLYLSEEQKRGLATGLLIGVALGAAVFVWGLAGPARRRR